MSLRVSAREKRLLAFVAESEGVSQSQLLHDRVVPWLVKRAHMEIGAKDPDGD